MGTYRQNRWVHFPGISKTKNQSEQLQQKQTSEVDQEIKLTQLEQSDAKDIFDTIDIQRDYPGNG